MLVAEVLAAVFDTAETTLRFADRLFGTSVNVASIVAAPSVMSRALL